MQRQRLGTFASLWRTPSWLLVRSPPPSKKWQRVTSRLLRLLDGPENKAERLGLGAMVTRKGKPLGESSETPGSGCMRADPLSH